jgi:hypothetical protein
MGIDAQPSSTTAARWRWPKATPWALWLLVGRVVSDVNHEYWDRACFQPARGGLREAPGVGKRPLGM